MLKEISGIEKETMNSLLIQEDTQIIHSGLESELKTNSLENHLFNKN